MHRFALRGFIVIPALAALMILAAGCSSSGHTSAPKTSPAATASHSAPSTTSGVAAACRRIQTTLGKAPSTLSNLALHPSSAKSQVNAFVSKLKSEAAAAGNPALKFGGQRLRELSAEGACIGAVEPGEHHLAHQPADERLTENRHGLQERHQLTGLPGPRGPQTARSDGQGQDHVLALAACRPERNRA